MIEAKEVLINLINHCGADNVEHNPYKYPFKACGEYIIRYPKTFVEVVLGIKPSPLVCCHLLAVVFVQLNIDERDTDMYHVSMGNFIKSNLEPHFELLDGLFVKQCQWYLQRFNERA